MASSFYTNILNRLIEIRDERATHANTATRVGTALIDMLLFFVDGFLSRTDPDTAQGKITFADGAKFGDNHGIDANGDATLHNVAVANDQAQGEVVATFGNTKDSLQVGTGTLITDDGRVQTTKMEVRGTLTVLDLIASQIHSLDGYYYFSDTMKIESVTKVVMEGSGTQTSYHIYDETEDAGVPDEDIRYLLTFEKEYDNDFLKFYDEDVILSIATDIEDRTAQREVTEGGNTGLHDITSWSWMHINATTEQDKQLWNNWLSDLTPEGASNLGALVTLYPSDAESGVVGNTPPQEGTYVTRRGNRITDPESPNYKGERQNSWCISVEEGRLTYYINQTTPTTGDENYGIAIGKLPDIKPVSNLGLEGEIGIYAKNLLVENLYTIRWAGNVKRVTIDKGEWNQADAANGAYFYKRDTDGSSVVTYTNVQVTHNGCVWQSTGTRTTDGTTAITSEPVLGSTDWVFISGQTHDVHYYATTETKNLDEGGVDMGSDPVLWKEDQSYFLSKTISGTENPYYYCALRPYMWRKTFRYAQASDDIGDHYEDEVPSDGLTVVEEAHLIGVYGETGVNYFITSTYDHIALDQSETSKTITETFSFFTDNGGVRTPFQCYAIVRKRTKSGEYSYIFHRFYGTGTSETAITVTDTDDAIEIYCNSSGQDMTTTYLIKKEIPIIKAAKGEPGDRGLSGPLSRLFTDELINGMTYYAGETIAGSSILYQDYIAIPCAGFGTSGIVVYRCTGMFTYTGATMHISDNYKTIGDIDTFMTEQVGTGHLFERVEVNAASAFFTYLIAQNAFIRMLTGSNFVITDNLGTILAGMGNRVDGDGKQYYLWSGGQDADGATFKVYADGTIDAMRGSFSGFLTSKETVITGKNVLEYIEDGINPHNGERTYVFDMDKVGATIAFYQEIAGVTFEGRTDVSMYPVGYGEIRTPMDEDNVGDALYFNLPYDIGGITSNYRSTFTGRFSVNTGINDGGLGLYRYFLTKDAETTVSVAEAMDKQTSDIPTSSDDAWWLYPFQYVATLGKKSRQLVGSKIVFRLYGQIFNGLTFTGICFENGGPTTLYETYTFEELKVELGLGEKTEYNAANLLTLECKLFEHRDGNDNVDYTYIGWVPTFSFLGYYDRYTIGLPDINE